MSADTNLDSMLRGLKTAGVGPGDNPESGLDRAFRSGFKSEPWPEVGPSSLRRRSLMMEPGPDMGLRTMSAPGIGPPPQSSGEGGGAVSGSQRSVNSGDVMRARWRKG